jgi:hypothetical protein
VTMTMTLTATATVVSTVRNLRLAGSLNTSPDERQAAKRHSTIHRRNLSSILASRRVRPPKSNDSLHH